MAIAVVIRVDGGPEIGYGHLIRSNALAEELLTRGHTVTVATTTPDSAQAVFADTVDIVDLPLRGDPEPFVEWLDTATPDIVFTDAYPVDTAYQQVVRERVPLAVLQDDARHAVCADLFINGNLYAPDIEYEFVSQESRECLSTDYLLLRQDISRQITRKAPFSASPESLIVLMGGSDVRNNTTNIIKAIEKSNYSEQVTVVMGPGCDNIELIEKNAKISTQQIDCVQDPNNLANRMFSADIAITSTGTTVYELLGLQTPFIGIPQIENQVTIGESLEKRNLANILQKQAPIDNVAGALNGFIQNINFRRRIHRIGPNIVDGLGVKRVADEVIELVEP